MPIVHALLLSNAGVPRVEHVIPLGAGSVQVLTLDSGGRSHMTLSVCISEAPGDAEAGEQGPLWRSTAPRSLRGGVG